MIKIRCGQKVRYVDDIVLFDSLGCSLVNKGREDLFDLGFTVEEIKKYGLKLTSKEVKRGASVH